jgi:hypothetical protein
LPKKALKRDNRYQRDKKRKLCKRRAAIEPIIGHLKSDFRLSRNLLKGLKDDKSLYRDLRINRNNHQKPTFHPLGDF